MLGNPARPQCRASLMQINLCGDSWERQFCGKMRRLFVKCSALTSHSWEWQEKHVFWINNPTCVSQTTDKSCSFEVWVKSCFTYSIFSHTWCSLTANRNTWQGEMTDFGSLKLMRVNAPLLPSAGNGENCAVASYRLMWFSLYILPCWEHLCFGIYLLFFIICGK